MRGRPWYLGRHFSGNLRGFVFRRFVVGKLPKSGFRDFLFFFFWLFDSFFFLQLVTRLVACRSFLLSWKSVYPGLRRYWSLLATFCCTALGIIRSTRRIKKARRAAPRHRGYLVVTREFRASFHSSSKTCDIIEGE